ncbi:AAA family ATPase [Leadbettera azotonutricia]|uniref:ABC transport protein, ATP-binding subunit n=1 Tax=Leadbettera azotonutricia (strain ATCC BAA-888 / DSM 13862 / ZAS-9) TaxID=545695 RepID=F5YB20_LEAAZ|nr:AAA family ATPase [Leadbettera azotonutricia]AEF80484.1 ABC transport protein, ATP-binding subunit [Leadbettera azotonutricia ZAS-9]
MHKINHFKISGFRRLYNLEMQMQPFMVLIGANGVGKTSFLDAFTTLSASAAGKLNNALSQFGGIANLLTRGKSDEIAFQLAMDVPGYDPLEYMFHTVPKGTGYSINREILSQQHPNHPDPFRYIDSRDNDIRYYEVEKKGLVSVDWEHNYLETSLSQVPKMFRQSEELRRILATASQYHVLDVGPRAPIKLPQSMKPATGPGADGGDLAPYLYYLRESERDKFDIITDSIRAVFPDFEDLNFPPAAAGMLTITWKDRNFNKPIYMHELSEGTLRFIWMVALLQSSDLSAVTMIDEPEVSLHPELLNILSELMREASKRTQLIVTTHSDRFIRFLKPEEVVVMDIDESGCTTAARADSLDLDRWLADYSLDEIWSMGRMRGRS